MRAGVVPGCPRPQRGLSFVELLVGIAIGLIGLLAIFQTVAIWNKHIQTTSAGGDAQVAGTLAMFSIERDLKLAGLGFGKATSPLMGCTVQASDTQPARAFTFSMSPIKIVPGAGGAPDEIDVLYGNSSFFTDAETFTASTLNTKKLTRRNGFKPGDLAIVAANAAALPASAACDLVEITDDSDPDGFTVAHTATNYVSYYAAASAASAPARYNTAAGTGITFSAGSIYDLGPLPQQSSWTIINSRALGRTDVIHGITPFEIADGVINLKAEYGVDANGDCQISPAEWVTADPADWSRVLAIRVAILVRSRQFERNGDSAASAAAAVTTNAPTWGNGDAAHTFLMTNVDGTPDSFAAANFDPNNWRYYRYRVYERVVALRNMQWGGAQCP